MDQNRDLLLFSFFSLSTAVLSLCQSVKKKQRRWWIRPINKTRKTEGHYDTIFAYMKIHDHEEFYEFTRMWPHKFDQLVELISPFLPDPHNCIRKPLPADLRVALTLSYLAHGNSVRSESWNYRIGRSTAYKIIPEVCQAIWKALQPTYLPEMSQEKWTKVADEFYSKWQFPNCIGAIDGKHVKIRCPSNSGSNFFNYKQYFSIILLATCDAQFKFTWVDIGECGSISDGGVWSRSKFGIDLENERVDLPPPKNLPKTNIPIHFTFVGDEAFPLKMYLLRPYSRKDLGDAERVFNYRLSRARRVIENTFGILVSRWQILTKTMCCNPDNATNIIKALVCLHNYIMTEEQHDMPNARAYCPPNLIDHETLEHDEILGTWHEQTGLGTFEDLTRIASNNASKNATKQRNTLRNHFVSPLGEQEAPWQYSCAFRGLVINDKE